MCVILIPENTDTCPFDLYVIPPDAAVPNPDIGCTGTIPQVAEASVISGRPSRPGQAGWGGSSDITLLMAQGVHTHVGKMGQDKRR